MKLGKNQYQIEKLLQNHRQIKSRERKNIRIIKKNQIIDYKLKRY